jgi:predicted RNase H-like nuclease (RuvC/YqgF family)
MPSDNASPQASEPTPAELKKENETLKDELDTLKGEKMNLENRLKAAEAKLGQQLAEVEATMEKGGLPAPKLKALKAERSELKRLIR